MKRILTYIGLGLLLMMIVLSVLILVPAACEQDKITVASKEGTEGSILAYMMILLLRDMGYDVIDKTWMGSTDEVRKALENGEIDIYPEYTGNGARFFETNRDDPGTWDQDWWDRQKGYDKVVELEESNKTRIEWLKPAPANNIWAITVTSAVAREKGLETITDFANYVENNDNIVLVYGSEEFFTSPMALSLFERIYDFKLNENQKVVVGTPAYAEQMIYALQPDKHDTLYAAMSYTTDAYLSELSGLDLTVLHDNLSAQPFFRPAPIMRVKITKEHPEIIGPLEELFGSLDTDTLQQLNSEAVEKFPLDVARSYLENNNFLRHGEPEQDDFPRYEPNPGFFVRGEEEMAIEILNARISVEPKTMWQTEFYYDDGSMSDVRISGWFMASGGAYNDVKVYILNEIDFINLSNFHDIEGIYKSEKQTLSLVEVPIEAPGKYYIVLSNRFSLFSSKSVLAKLNLYYKSPE
ncbi:glycine betaine ABC transporter substrate-binding protein [Chloroflexota bacterium]